MRRRRLLLALPLSATLALAACDVTEPTAQTAQPLAYHSLSFTTSSSPIRLDDPTRLLVGVIGGPLSPDGATPPIDVSSQLADIGVKSIRNNDYYDDRLDVSGIFNCARTGPNQNPECSNLHSRRTEFPCWESCDYTQANRYSWSKSDVLFDSMVAGGFEPFLRFGASFKTSTAGGYDFAGPKSITEVKNLLGVAERFYDRYTARPSYGVPVRYLDLWTEKSDGPDNFWSWSDSEFVDFWTQLYTTVKTSFPAHAVGGPGFAGSVVNAEIMAGYASAGSRGFAVRFLNALYDRGIKPDWLGYHQFSHSPIDHMRAHQAMHDLLHAEGIWAVADRTELKWADTGWFDETELVYDAFGIHHASDLDRDTCAAAGVPTDEETCLNYVVSGAASPTVGGTYRLNERGAGAASLTGAWITVAINPEVKRAYVYRAASVKQAEPSVNGVLQPGDYGVIAADGTFKPRANAMRLWSRMIDEYPTLLDGAPYSYAGGTHVWELAGKRVMHGVASYAVLVANPSRVDKEVSLSIDGAAQTSFRTVKVFTVDDLSDGETPSATYSSWSAPARIEVPAQSVLLVTLGS